jgi:hypothetical protein
MIRCVDGYIDALTWVLASKYTPEENAERRAQRKKEDMDVHE